jgi:hypothetical protein
MERRTIVILDDHRYAMSCKNAFQLLNSSFGCIGMNDVYFRKVCMSIDNNHNCKSDISMEEGHKSQ